MVGARVSNGFSVFRAFVILFVEGLSNCAWIWSFLKNFFLRSFLVFFCAF